MPFYIMLWLLANTQQKIHKFKYSPGRPVQ
jgi:hypothetical protein